MSLSSLKVIECVYLSPAISVLIKVFLKEVPRLLVPCSCLPLCIVTEDSTKQTNPPLRRWSTSAARGSSSPLFAGNPPPFAATSSPGPVAAHVSPSATASPPTEAHVPLGLLVAYEGMRWSSAQVPAPRQRPPAPAPRQRPPVPAPKQRPPVPAPRQRPPVPAPRQRPPVPAPRQHPPVPAPRQRPPVLAPRQCPPVPAPRQRPASRPALHRSCWSRPATC